GSGGRLQGCHDVHPTLPAAQAVGSRCACRASMEHGGRCRGSAVLPSNRPDSAAAINGSIAGGPTEQAYKHRARNVGEPASRGKYKACVHTTFFVHRVTERSALRRSAPPRIFGGLEWKAKGSGVPRAANNRGDDACLLHFTTPALLHLSRL